MRLPTRLTAVDSTPPTIQQVVTSETQESAVEVDSQPETESLVLDQLTGRAQVLGLIHEIRQRLGAFVEDNPALSTALSLLDHFLVPLQAQMEDLGVQPQRLVIESIDQIPEALKAPFITQMEELLKGKIDEITAKETEIKQLEEVVFADSARNDERSKELERLQSELESKRAALEPAWRKYEEAVLDLEKRHLVEAGSRIAELLASLDRGKKLTNKEMSEIAALKILVGRSGRSDSPISRRDLKERVQPGRK